MCSNRYTAFIFSCFSQFVVMLFKWLKAIFAIELDLRAALYILIAAAVAV